MKESTMWHARGALLVAVTLVLAAAILPVTTSALVNASDDEPVHATAALSREAPAPSSQLAAAAGAQSGSCEESALLLSRSFVGRFGEQEWWARGFLTGTSVGTQLIDPAGRTTSMGSAPVDSLCEASGILPIGDRVTGVYTLIVSGTRPSGESVDLTASFNIVSLVHAPTPTPAPQVPPVPRAPGGVRATAVDANTIRVVWTDNSDNETGFRLDGEAGQFRVGPNTTSFNAGGLLPGTIYCFSVYAFNASGESYGGTSCTVTPARPGF
jgi:hypothetical protein